MNCQLIIIGTVPLLLITSIIHYCVCKYRARRLNAKIVTNINNVWSGYGGGTQITEVAALANRLTEKMNNNPSVITSFGLATIILTALVTTLYTINELNSGFCSNNAVETSPISSEAIEE